MILRLWANMFSKNLERFLAIEPDKSIILVDVLRKVDNCSRKFIEPTQIAYYEDEIFAEWNINNKHMDLTISNSNFSLFYLDDKKDPENFEGDISLITEKIMEKMELLEQGSDNE